MSLFELVALGRSFWVAIQAKDWASALSALGKLLEAAATFFKQPMLATASSHDDAASLDTLIDEMSAPQAVMADNGPQAIDPATIAILVQLAVKVLEFIRKRRQAT